MKKHFGTLTPSELSGYLLKRYSNYVRILPTLSEVICVENVHGEIINDIISLPSEGFSNFDKWNMFKELFPSLKQDYPRLKILWFSLCVNISKNPEVDLTGVILPVVKKESKQKKVTKKAKERPKEQLSKQSKENLTEKKPKIQEQRHSSQNSRPKEELRNNARVEKVLVASPKTPEVFRPAPPPLQEGSISKAAPSE